MRTSSLVTAACVAATLVLAPVGPGQADPGGSCTIAMPQLLVITQPTTRFWISTRDDCEANTLGWATWRLERTADQQVVAELYYDRDEPAALDWDDETDGFGHYFLHGAGAFDIDVNPLTQNEGYVAVKAASRSTMVVTRNRSSVTVTVGASYYNARRNGQIPWAGAPVQVQTSNALNGRWTTVTTLTTGADGLATAALYAPATRYWRALTPTTRSVWGRYSVPIYR